MSEQSQTVVCTATWCTIEYGASVGKGLTVHAVARSGEKLAALADHCGVVPHAVDITRTADLTELLAGLEIDDLRLSDRLHVDENIFPMLAFPCAVQEAVSLYPIEPFHLHRLILARGTGKRLAIRAICR